MVDHQSYLYVHTFRSIKIEQRNLEAKVERAIAVVSELDKIWRDKTRRDSTITDQERQIQANKRKGLVARQLNLMKSAHFLRFKGAELAGRWVDNRVVSLEGRRTDADWSAYLDAAISEAFKPMKAGTVGDFWLDTLMGPTPMLDRDRVFRINVLNAYGANHAADFTIWCPVAQDYVLSVVATRIVPVGIGKLSAYVLFGSGHDDIDGGHSEAQKDRKGNGKEVQKEEHIWSTRNGLPLSRDYATWIDEAKAVILPITDKPDETNFRFFLLTTDGLRRRSNLTQPLLSVDELHGRDLVFKTNFRPNKEYLYFQYVMALLRRQREGLVEDLNRPHPTSLALPYAPQRSLWAMSNRSSEKRNMLYCYSRQRGCITVEEADEFWGVQR